MSPLIKLPNEWTDYELQVIAGFLFYFRAGVLAGIDAAQDPSADPLPNWQIGERNYWECGEMVTRWLLSYTPWPVKKNEGFTPQNPL